MRRDVRFFVVGGLMVAIGLALFAAPFASASPDGLEKVSQDAGFAATANEHALSVSPLADYGVSGVRDERLSTGLAGVVGTLVTFGVGSILFGFIVRASARRAQADPGPTPATG